MNRHCLLLKMSAKPEEPPIHHVRMALRPQLCILRLFGLKNLGSPKDHRCWRRGYVIGVILRVIGVVWILSGWVCFLFNLAVAVQAFIATTSGGSSILAFISLLPYATLTFRSAAVPSLFLLQLASFERLLRECDDLVGFCYAGNEEQLRRVGRKWRRLAVAFTAGAVCLQVLWETVESITYQKTTGKTYTSDGALDPLPVGGIMTFFMKSLTSYMVYGKSWKFSKL